MAQYKISSRIERVLRLRNPGSGVLSRLGWSLVCVIAISTLYVSAAAQSRTSTQMPALAREEIVRVLQQSVPVREQSVLVAARAPQPLAPAQEPLRNTVSAPSAAPVQNGPGQLSPDLVGEIRLILAPVDQVQNATPGQDLQLGPGTGPVVWRARNGALSFNRWNWIRNGIVTSSVFTFALTRAQGRSLFFETSQGGTFSYGCADCSFIASEAGVGVLSGGTAPGIIFRLSGDGKSVTATCRAVGCVLGLGAEIRNLNDTEMVVLGVPQPVPVDPINQNRDCFSVFGSIKADGTPFTAADCPGGAVAQPAIFFSITR